MANKFNLKWQENHTEGFAFQCGTLYSCHKRDVLQSVYCNLRTFLFLFFYMKSGLYRLDRKSSKKKKPLNVASMLLQCNKVITRQRGPHMITSRMFFTLEDV